MAFFRFLCSVICFPLFNCFESPIIKTTSGYVRGKSVEALNCSVNQYMNIPYAESPVGKLRFSRPVPLIKPIKQLIDGTKAGSSCYQYEVPPGPTLIQSEDCLVLNIWTSARPNSQDHFPVMFYIHGGHYDYNSIFQSLYNGSALAAHGVVVVTANYRLGPFGFLYGGDETAPGNIGLYDQLMALHWVKNNIHLFGGDPNQITIFGQSAGSWSSSAHIVSPLTKGIFKRAIIQSGTILPNKDIPDLPKDKAFMEAKSFAKYFNCYGMQWLDCLRSVDADRLNSVKNLTIWPIFGTEYLPFSVQQAFRRGQYLSDIEVMSGVVKDEGPNQVHRYYPEAENLHSAKEFMDLVESLPLPNLNAKRITEYYLKGVNTTSTEALEKAFNQFYGDQRFTCPTYLFAKLFAGFTPQKNVFFYFWTYVSRKIKSELDGCIPPMAVCHTSDNPYVFGEPLLNSTYDMMDKNFSSYVMKMWTNFAKYGNPLQGFPPNFIWPRLLKVGTWNDRTIIKEINPLRVNDIIDNLFVDTCDGFWKNYFI